MSNLILANFYQCNNKILTNLFKCYVRPILEYGSIIFSPRCIYLIDLIEHVQRNFTKHLHGLKNKSYNDRLKICGLELLECCRVQKDLIFLYKILNNLVLLNFDNDFIMCCNVRLNVCIRGNNINLKNSFYLNIRKYFFTCRTVNVWNSLANDVCHKNVSMFVGKLHFCEFLSYFKGYMYN